MVQQRALMELLLTGEPITAQRAREIGFVNHVVPAAELLPRCLRDGRDDRRQRAADGARGARAGLPVDRDGPLGGAARGDRTCSSRVYRSDDAQEGPRAFREKRQPEWQGR